MMINTSLHPFLSVNALCCPISPFLTHARAPQVTLLLHSLDLEDYAQAFALAKINGRKLNQCSTREELKEDWDIDMPRGPFRTLRAAVEEYTSSGLPTSLLDEARERVQQREPAPAAAPTPAPAPAPAPAPVPGPRRRRRIWRGCDAPLSQGPQQRRAGVPAVGHSVGAEMRGCGQGQGQGQECLEEQTPGTGTGMPRS